MSKDKKDRLVILLVNIVLLESRLNRLRNELDVLSHDLFGFGLFNFRPSKQDRVNNDEN